MFVFRSDTIGYFKTSFDDCQQEKSFEFVYTKEAIFLYWFMFDKIVNFVNSLIFIVIYSKHYFYTYM